MTYLWVKWIHILASTLLFGTGLGIAFFMWLAHLRGDARVIAATARITRAPSPCSTGWKSMPETPPRCVIGSSTSASWPAARRWRTG